MFAVGNFFMQYKLELMEVFNNEKSAVILGFIFYQDLYCVFAAISLNVTLKMATLFQTTR